MRPDELRKIVRSIGVLQNWRQHLQALRLPEADERQAAVAILQARAFHGQDQAGAKVMLDRPRAKARRAR